MKFDISEIGAIQCQLNFDEDYYLDYLQENEFNAAKSSILKRLTKKLNKFKNSINKILNDFYSISHK